MTTILETIRSSCAYSQLDSEPDISIDIDAIKRFVDNIDLSKYNELSKKSNLLPLRFESVKQELNLLCLGALLAFGSGYRKELHETIDRGAATAIQFGLMAIHISGIEITTKWMKEVTTAEISELFDIPVSTETAALNLPGVTLTRDGPLKPLVLLIKSAISETGDLLEDLGYDSFGDFILHITKLQNNQPRTAAYVVEKLVKTFPAFRDVGRWNGEDIYILKKAQLLVYELSERFPSHPQFKFSDLPDLTVLSDNVIPSTLIHFGMLKVPNSVTEMIKNGEDISGNNGDDVSLERWDWRLRAVAIIACDKILELLNEKRIESGLEVTRAVDLDTYLWSWAKEGGNKAIPRLSVKNTVYF